jgi:tryptophan synthase beta chain
MLPIKGDGLRYHAASPLISFLKHELGLIDAITFPADEKYVFDRARFFIRNEGVFPAPESSYAVAQLIDQALICKKNVNEGKIDEAVLLANISGHGLLDTKGFSEVLGDKIRDDVSAEDLSKSLAPQPFS